MKLAELKEEYCSCTKCFELVDNRNQIVFGSGNENADVLIIGEAPGQSEDEQGIPFVGRSGQVLNSFLEKINLNREDIFITNTVLCRPPNNRNPSIQELSNCRTRLDKTIEIINPKAIITLGNFATKYVLNTKEGITKLRGAIHHINGKKVIPMQHPAVLLYNGNSPEKRKEFEDDFELVKKILEEF